MRRAYGEVLAEAGQLAQAQAELNKVLEASPDDLRARRALALVLASRRAGPELVADLEEVVRLQPDSVDARMDLRRPIWAWQAQRGRGGLRRGLAPPPRAPRPP